MISKIWPFKKNTEILHRNPLSAMASKSDKEKKTTPKAAPGVSDPGITDPGKKNSAKSSKKEDEDDDDVLDDEDETPKSASKKSSKPSKASKSDDEEDEGDAPEEEDDWEKVEEEDNWDPDFEEFDLPKSKTKKGPSSGAGKKPAKDEDDLGIDDDFKDMDLFNDSGFDDEEDDF